MNLKNHIIYEKMNQYSVAGLSLAVIRDGKLDETIAFGTLESGTTRTVTTNSIFNSCSISKFITAMLVLTLSDQEIVPLDEDVNDRLTSWNIPTNLFTSQNKVTLRNLLSHQSGIIDPPNSFEHYTLAQGRPNLSELLAGKTSYCPVPIEVTYKPKSEFHYSDANFCIIELLLEDITGKPFNLLLEEYIFQPLQLKNSILFSTKDINKMEAFACGHNKDGTITNEKYPFYPFAASSGIWTTPTDLSTLVIEIIHSLQGMSKLKLSQKLVQDMISPQGCSKWTGLGVFLDDSNKDLQMYSLGWGVGFQCMMVCYPYRGNGAVIMTNADLGVHQMKGIIGDVLKTLSL
ncbi:MULTISPECIES: serine hydrolase domain-containing protein [Bacillus]|uniref:Penicillin-binding protein n=1 Tax=Bacillus wiedmannii TaxID=1890302 RepID=A0A1A9PSY4_9BACI|nr:MULTISPECIES: serine hydrolase domain-containing protein [Bacillus]OUB84707.1 penicillin-binding protein [Bacillus thuringiensis serovar sinensis]MBY7112054.1 beta-lactamase family protein [Bacillus sp. 17RED48]MBY7121415.1 beta-lactamase family protein [Bacillus sp. 16GRE42]MCU5111545.1 beta-lactamase family protein [Bacillus wiedmannii]MCU5150983.1 beta-lactamase family protein [Bacillus wiedmannii]